MVNPAGYRSTFSVITLASATATLVFISLFCTPFIRETHAAITHTQPKQNENLQITATASESGRNRQSGPWQFLQTSRSTTSHEYERSDRDDRSFEASDTNEEDGRIASMNVSPIRRLNLPQYTSTQRPPSPTPTTARPATTQPSLNNRNRTRKRNRSASITDNSIKKDLSPSTCLTCSSQQAMASMAPMTAREIRLEMIKNQILRKLRLRQPPSANQLGSIPEYVHKALQQYQHVHQDHNDDNDDADLGDDFDDESRTEQIIVFPENVQTACGESESNDNLCLTFTVPNEIHKEKVSSAELLIYAPSQTTSTSTSTPSSLSSTPSKRQPLRFSVADISPASNRQIYAHEFGENTDSWLKLNITDVVSNWAVSNFSQIMMTKSELKTLRITCETCSSSASSSNSTGWITHATNASRPFLIVNMDDTRKKNRKRRSINCRPGVNECCREHLEVDFDEIKWDWIIEPRKYNAYYCKGSCLDRNGNFLTSGNSSQRAAHLEKIISQRGINNETRAMLPCCSATKMSAISILYYASNGTAINKKVPNMVVESCGCH